MSGGFNDLLDFLEDSEFEETPVDLRTFVEGKEHLGLPPLSEEQYILVAAMTQVYKKDTLLKWLGEEEGLKRHKQTVQEVIAQLGKGSGKDYCSTIAVARVVYLLLCLKDPAAYFGKPPGDSIDILNIAINSQQARNVFFKGFKTRVEKSPWFAGKFYAKADSIEFDKNITCHSGHSERESWEGYNVIMVILDEISGFAIENTTGHTQAKTAGDIYKMYRGSVISRFPEVGKVILLSFPRYKNDFIQQRYNAAIAEKVTSTRDYTFTIDEDLPEGSEGNTFTIYWEHDEIVSYRAPRTYAIRRATWEVNPTWNLDSAMGDFWADPVDAMSRFACMPPEAIDAFFKSREKVESAFSLPQKAFEEDGKFQSGFLPDPDKEYFVHVDLAYKHDRCAVAMAHVDGWEKIKIGDNYSEPAPRVVVDAIKWWTPKSDANVNFDEVRNYVISLRQRGFNLKLVTFDRWQSIDSINILGEAGLESDRLSVAKKHYDILSLLVQEERVKGPANNILIDEMLELRIMRGEKVDHPRKGGKDLADAVCGAVFNSVAHSEFDTGVKVIEIRFLEHGAGKATNELKQKQDGVIRPPRSGNEMAGPSTEIMDFLNRMKVL